MRKFRYTIARDPIYRFTRDGVTHIAQAIAFRCLRVFNLFWKVNA